MSGARHATSLHLLFKNPPRGAASEQTNQLDQARISTVVTLTKPEVRLDEPKRSFPLLTMTSLHLRAIKPQLQEQWPYDWREQVQKQLESKENTWRGTVTKTLERRQYRILARHSVVQ
jgi:thymidylate synthase